MIDKNLVCEMYKDGKSMRQIALLFGTNHKRISRILKDKNIQTRKPKNLKYKKSLSAKTKDYIIIWLPT